MAEKNEERTNSSGSQKLSHNLNEPNGNVPKRTTPISRSLNQINPALLSGAKMLNNQLKNTIKPKQKDSKSNLKEPKQLAKKFSDKKKAKWIAAGSVVLYFLFNPTIDISMFEFGLFFSKI